MSRGQIHRPGKYGWKPRATTMESGRAIVPGVLLWGALLIGSTAAPAGSIPSHPGRPELETRWAQLEPAVAGFELAQIPIRPADAGLEARQVPIQPADAGLEARQIPIQLADAGLEAGQIQPQSRGVDFEPDPIGDLPPDRIQDLVLLGKVWGFLKYHHPRITSGDMARGWDNELIRILPECLRAIDRESFRQFLGAWLDQIGEPGPCAPCAELPDSLQSRPRLDWIRDRSLLDRRLSDRLDTVYKHRLSGADQARVDLVPGVRNPRFYERSVDSVLVVSDFRYRLLALYRFWNIIEYWFPHRDVMEEDWDRVLTEFIPRMSAASTWDSYRLELMALIARIHDSHANLWSAVNDRPPGAAGRLPLIVRHVGNQYVITGYPEGDSTAAAGLRPGDVILRIDGVAAEDLVAGYREYYGASNDAALQRELAASLAWGSAGPCRLIVRREGEPFEVELQRAPVAGANRRLRTFHELPGPAFQMLTPEVAYLRASIARSSEAPSYIREASAAKCLIIDLRSYPKEFLPFTLGGHLIARPAEFVCGTHGDLNNPGAFVWTRPLRIEPKEPRYDGEIRILVDETSESLAEFTAMAFQAAPGARVVGSTTAGADGNVSRIPFPGGEQGAISGIGIFYPDRQPAQRVGVRIDLEVHPTIEGIRAGRDEVLEAAVRDALGRDPEWTIVRFDR